MIGCAKPATAASARTTSVCATPTRKPPVIILFHTSRSAPLSSRHVRSSNSFFIGSAASRIGSSRSEIKACSGKASVEADSGSSNATVSARSPTAS